MNYKAYMRSDEWKALREKKLEACQHKCECEGGCYREATQIHHYHYETLGDESFEDLQALCAKCHMKKSNVRGFYGNVVMDCCQHLPDTEPPEKILPYHVWHEANFRLQIDGLKCQVIARKLGAEPIIAALLDNLGILGSSLKKRSHETLFLELARRGCDLSKLRENDETAAEIIKIG